MKQIAPRLRRASAGVSVFGAQDYNRTNFASAVTIDGADVATATKIVSEGLAGLSFLSRNKLQAYAAAADPRVFNLSPDAFTPVGNLAIPHQGSVLSWHGRDYQVGRVAYDDSGEGNTLGLMLYCYRVLMEVFPAKLYRQFTPDSMMSQTAGGSKSVSDLSYTAAGTVLAFAVPMDETESALAVGDVDTRADKIITATFISRGSVLVDPDRGADIWQTLADTETFPAPTLLVAPARHLPAAPAGVS